VVRARLLITIVVVLLTGVAVAVARTGTAPSLSVNEVPVAAGGPAALALRATFSGATHGELSAVEMDLTRGLSFDPRAAGVCSNAQAHAARCPRASVIGRGTGTKLPSGYTLSVLALTTLLQAHRTVSGVGYDLLTNPGSCPRHGWPVQAQIESGGRAQVLPGQAACSL
jgi:hypothetical protein